MDENAIKRTDEIVDGASRISEFTERSWGYRLIRGKYFLEKESQSLLTSAATEKELKKDFEEYG